MKKIGILFVIVILFFSIVSCQSTGTTPSTKETATTKATPTPTPTPTTTTTPTPTTTPPVDTKTVVAGQWAVYTCDVIPTDASLGVLAFASSNASGTTRNEIVDDPALKGNKLFLHISEKDNRLQYKNILGNQKSMLTVVIRAKAFNNESKDINFEVDANIQPMGFREKVLGTKDNKVRLFYSKVESTKTVDMMEWHTYRMTFSPSGVNVYVDESDTPILSAPKPPQGTGDDYYRFGSSDRTVAYGCYYDWVSWTTDGAFSPKESPLPAGLTGIK
jgi:hypothetical protein